MLSFTVYQTGDRGSGILYAFRGLGALLGPFLARPFIRERDLRSLFAAISVALAVYGIFYGVVPWMPTIWLAGVFVMLGPPGRRRAVDAVDVRPAADRPDRIRGRVSRSMMRCITFTLAVSSLLAGWAAEYDRASRTVMVGLAAVELAVRHRLDDRYAEGGAPSGGAAGRRRRSRGRRRSLRRGRRRRGRGSEPGR